jgi:UDP-N-acetylglucosamine/UDP-N-acetylgalactosamine diphosphorylase
MTAFEDLRARLQRHGQEHVLRFWNVLSEAERRELASDLDSLDFDLLARLAPMAARAGAAGAPSIAPPEVVWHSRPEIPAALRRSLESRAGLKANDLSRVRAAVEERGRRLLREGKVALVLVAGGQATRLGFDQPKGLFEIGPVSRRSLFEFHADRIAALTRIAGKQPLWFVMTSPQNHAATVEYFRAKHFFGLDESRIVLHPQDMVPGFDRAGRLLLESKSRLFRNPSGHGGTLTALAASGFLARCRAEGVEHLFYWQVDNPLVRIGEPLFLGFHDLHGASGMSSKVVAKRGPEEKVGILAACDGRNICVEYSDLPGELRDARDERGDLLYRAGNIAIHALRVGFVESLTKGGLRLPWHRAEKKIRCVDESGAPIEVPGIKFETFIFDALPMSEDTVTLEVLRDDEFAPVKNASGEDSPEVARDAIRRYYARWFAKAGIALPNHRGGGPPDVEVSPLFAFDFAEFAAKRASIPKDPASPLYLRPGKP